MLDSIGTPNDFNNTYLTGSKIHPSLTPAT